MRKIFISYAVEDYEIAKKLYGDLKKAELEPWLDQKDLLPGQNWRQEIPRIIKNSRYFILLISSHSVSKRGFIQKEQKIALDVRDEFPDDEIFIIPIRLDSTEPANEELKDLHWADFSISYENGLKQVLRAIQLSETEEIFEPSKFQVHEKQESHKPPTLQVPEEQEIPEPAKPRFSRFAFICEGLMILAGIIVGYFLIQIPNISGIWELQIGKTNEIWKISQKSSDITIVEQDSDMNCSGTLQRSGEFTFSCLEPRISGEASVAFTGSGQINETHDTIIGIWKRQGREGKFTLIKRIK